MFTHALVRSPGYASSVNCPSGWFVGYELCTEQLQQHNGRHGAQNDWVRMVVLSLRGGEFVSLSLSASSELQMLPLLDGWNTDELPSIAHVDDKVVPVPFSIMSDMASITFSEVFYNVGLLGFLYIYIYIREKKLLKNFLFLFLFMLSSVSMAWFFIHWDLKNIFLNLIFRLKFWNRFRVLICMHNYTI